MDFGIQLKNIRKQKGYTQDDLVSAINAKYRSKLTKSTLSRYENNHQEPSAETVRQIADILGVSPGTLMILPKDCTEISEIIREAEEKLTTASGLSLHGEPVSQEDIEKIITAMKIGMEMINKENKKFTPRKYRKEE